ncbi:DNA replication and repair protein RecF [Geodia barretti]|uniref:DNA replication and repair protein RecF n=1 Tax=Geodia barretti TaxID=519541 RepID=A0AA35SWQ5_GEOBA|nr:DNA replication and repair protein RecF [Geodia barretti]
MARITRLSLVNYRNFREVDIAPPAGVSVFHGGNAQGKTSLLEAAYTLAVGRSFRTERERQVLNFDAARDGGAAYITGTACVDGQSLTVVIGYQPTARESGASGGSDAASPGPATLPPVTKQIRINRQPATAAGLVGRIAASLFFRGRPGALQRFQAALRNRNGLLRRRRDGHVDPEELQYWDEQLVQSGAVVTFGRSEALARLSVFARRQHGELGEPEQDLALEYLPSVPPGESVEDIASAFQRELQRVSAREQATAITAVGPHRDNFATSVNGLDAASFASRGEARTIALALRLAEAEYLAEVRGDDPVILLDDVFSEMDDRRRERVLQKVARYRQTLVTTTDVGPVREALGNSAAYFSVADGAVTREASSA